MIIKYENVLKASNFFLASFIDSLGKLSEFSLLEIVLGIVYAEKNVLKLLERINLLPSENIATIEKELEKVSSENIFNSEEINKIINHLTKGKENVKES
jgi:hypothetical protein